MNKNFTFWALGCIHIQFLIYLCVLKTKNKMDFLFTADAFVALITLTFLEIVLGIDNVIFVSIVTGKLPEHQRKRATRLGLFLAMFLRIALL